MKQVVIVSPHCDDELIGTFSILSKLQDITIIYTESTTEQRIAESKNLGNFFSIKEQFFQEEIPNYFLNKNTTFYFPDHTFEIHFAHRKQGFLGETLLRKFGFDIVFYSISMNVPYIFEVQDVKRKEEILNLVYPSQASLWEFEKKFILFEGYNKWIL